MRYAHTNIIARDWRKLAQFYIDVFDCKPKLPERDLAGNWLDKVTGLKEAYLKGMHLVLPGYGNMGPTLEIFTYDRMDERPAMMPNQSGFSHIAFEVDDVDDTFQKAILHGGQKLGEIVEKEIENVGVIKFTYLRDPEGNIIEIQSWKK